MNLLNLLVLIVIVGLVFYLLYWLIGVIALPEPFHKVAVVILSLAAVVFLIGILTGQVSLPLLRIR